MLGQSGACMGDDMGLGKSPRPWWPAALLQASSVSSSFAQPRCG
ncbi:hypothetical protein ACSLNH_06335 [Comamonas kerstersii]